MSNILLALDTSTQTAGMALYDGANVIGESVWMTANHHTIEVAPALQELLHRCGVTAGDLGAIAVATGPGSFTGLRIGFAVAKGVALAARVPMVGIPTMDIHAASVPMKDIPLVTVLQAGRGRLAAAWYKPGKTGWEMDVEPELTNIDALAEKLEIPVVVCGELTISERQTLAKKRKIVQLATPAQSLRRPGYLAELGWRKWKTGKLDNVELLAPTYLRTGDALPV
ncbi:MAG TPA: tRNA (adenosine(37)-N6)-threonylcarbamoyltransferase complex dimerization subunit type 1 TsaB [Bellilinea sp.]|nr:tRNA (adenosine(37)-N6)-threonylcarbamoyltransferase complex dimerization subunit type 1 TsaB [Bellilinea sp.]